MNEARRRRRRRRLVGSSLVEVLAALGLVSALGVIASSAGLALSRWMAAARAEAVGLAAAEEILERLAGLDRAHRLAAAPGADELEVEGHRFHREWSSTMDDPAPGLTRLEVRTAWAHPSPARLTMVGVLP